MIVQTPEELERETLGTVIGICRDMERCAEKMDVAGLEVHFNFLKVTMGRLETIRKNIRITN